MGRCLAWFCQRRQSWLGNAEVCAGRCVAWCALQLEEAPACPWGSTAVVWLGSGVAALAAAGFTGVFSTWTGRSGDKHEVYSYAANLDLRQWHRVLLAAACFPGKIKANVCNCV